MCLFFNACYFPFWLVVDVVVAADKYEHLNYLYKFILVTVLIAAVLIEVTRAVIQATSFAMEISPRQLFGREHTYLAL